MSRTYKLACGDCRVAVWIGQGYISVGDPIEHIRDAGNIYSTVTHIARLRDFLFLHMGHPLVFHDSEALSGEDYEDFEDGHTAPARGAACDDVDGA